MPIEPGADFIDRIKNTYQTAKGLGAVLIFPLSVGHLIYDVARTWVVTGNNNFEI